MIGLIYTALGIAAMAAIWAIVDHVMKNYVLPGGDDA